jgi:hypothetical protein
MGLNIFLLANSSEKLSNQVTSPVTSGSKDAKILQEKIKHGEMVESRPVV